MKRRDGLFWVLVVIAFGTLLSGVTQILAPGFVLGMVGGDTGSASATYTFGIIGMFMALFGGLMAQALLDEHDHPIILLWAALQKLGAAVAVTVGVREHHLGTLALAVGAFDALTGILLLLYRRRVTVGGVGA